MEPLGQSFEIAVMSSSKAISLVSDSENVVSTYLKDKELPIFLGDSFPLNKPPRTIIEVFEEQCTKGDAEDALFYRGPDNKWVSMSWQNYNKEVKYFARSLIQLNVTPFKAINIIAGNSHRWPIALLGGIYAGLVGCGITTTFNDESCQFIAEDSECECLVVENLAQFRKYENNEKVIKNLKAIVVLKQLTQYELDNIRSRGAPIYNYRDFIQMGKRYILEKELAIRMKLHKPGSCCNIIYTSGTEGMPKAVMLSHDNITWTVDNFLYQLKDFFETGKEKSLSFLPLSHIAAQFMDIFMPIGSLSKTYFTYKTEVGISLFESLREVKPTIFFAVPRVYEKIEDKLRLFIKNESFFTKGLSYCLIS